uniref:GST C-terminal domain-containing protein n=1 Tax=Acrobeloides nanus TaxID=290746 RepID=A0A914C600_9BILA
MRVFGIKYEVMDTILMRSDKGLLPFIELNGQHLADSQLIIMALQKHFNIDAKENLSEEQLGIIRCVDRMLEGSFYNANYIFKLLNNSLNFATVVTEDRNPKFLKYIVAPVLYYKAKKRGEAEGTAKHSQEECLSILRNDMKAMDQVLGNKDFLIGNKPTLADCTLFGHLASSYYLPYDMPLKQILDEEFPRIKNHMERMASLYFKDHQIGQQS